MTSIPANQFVNVIPSVLQAGGNPLSPNAVFQTKDTSIPIGTVKSFATQADVAAWFGPASDEAQLAAIYFNGFAGASLLPGLLYFQQYPDAAVGAYLRGGSLAGMTLAQLQALSGNLTISVDGVSSTSAAINLSGATSFTNAAALIQTGIQAGTPASTATCVWDALRSAFVVRSDTTGATSTIGFATGTLAAGLKLQAAQGAVTSQGADATTPAAQVALLVNLNQNWVTLMTVWEPDADDKVAWATAISAQGERYVYVGWDTEAAPANGDAPSSFARQTANLDGRVAIWGLSGITGAVAKAAWFCGATASINRNETNGRLTYAYKGQAGLIPDVTDATTYSNLIANGYCAYVAVATANDNFQFFQDGSISGEWGWADTYVNQILMNSAFQLALITLLTQAKSIPYVTRGYNLIRAALLDPIRVFLNFGAIVAGVTLSSQQRALVNNAAGGLNIADTIQSQGWYLLIQDAPPEVRALRDSPSITFWYTDGGSIQKIDLSSIAVE